MSALTAYSHAPGRTGAHPPVRTPQRPPLALVPSTFKSEPIFSWDATLNLNAAALREHRERFPAFQGFTPQLSELPDAGAWAANLAVGLCEIMLKQRPIQQVERWFIPGLYRAFTHQMPALILHSTKRSPVKVITYRSCAISERIVEACVILDTQGNRTTLSLRLEGHRGKWIATALQIL